MDNITIDIYNKNAARYADLDIDKVSLIINEMERLSPNSVQTLEIKIRRALLRKEDIEDENPINLQHGLPLMYSEGNINNLIEEANLNESIEDNIRYQFPTPTIK